MNTKAKQRKVYAKLFQFVSESYFLKKQGFDVELSHQSLRMVLNMILTKWNLTHSHPEDFPPYSIDEYFEELIFAIDMNMRAYPDEVYDFAIKQQIDGELDVINQAVKYEPSFEEAKKISYYINNTFGDVLFPFIEAKINLSSVYGKLCYVDTDSIKEE